jgi:hypothetical protein
LIAGITKISLLKKSKTPCSHTQKKTVLLVNRELMGGGEIQKEYFS